MRKFIPANPRGAAAPPAIDVFSHKERSTIGEVFQQYALTPRAEKTAWQQIADRWRGTSGRFYAYTVAHEIAATIERGQASAGI